MYTHKVIFQDGTIGEVKMEKRPKDIHELVADMDQLNLSQPLLFNYNGQRYGLRPLIEPPLRTVIKAQT